ncbi:hypothetical protein R1flu_028128 [Riccia fluitans]|uniref:Nitrate reductase n=1 Tax=Riccia fluitans TaxID=41844 RepID=A0ABD1XKW5_9MARC
MWSDRSVEFHSFGLPSISCRRTRRRMLVGLNQLQQQPLVKHRGEKYPILTTSALGRGRSLVQTLATLSTIKDNLRVKTSFHKSDAASPRVVDQPNRNSDGGDGESILLFSAISGYKEKTPTTCPPTTDQFGSFRATDSPRRYSLSSRDRERAYSFNSEYIPATEVFNGNTSMDYRDLNGPVMLREPPVEGREAEEDFNGEVGLQRGEIISTSRDLEEEEEEMWQFPPKVSGLSLDRRDLATDDKWVPRHPDLIRVKGHHPLNAEPPLSTLMHFGFLTPTSLHYVRNHGAVPQAGWESWIIEVTGLMDKPKKFTMRDLLCFPSRRLPVTLMCSGNRSKELSKGGKTTGLKWGPGAVSTSVWGGARLYDVLQHCGVHMPKKRGVQYFVCCSGADKPDGDDKKGTLASSSFNYGTSIPLEVAMDQSRDVLLAYEQNGDLLTPDHGFPVRLIVPGFTGGRSVKWLNKIDISAEPSDNFYHLYDNRMLPSHVLDLESAISEGWMSKPEFTINEMNINSVICTPAHSQSLTIDRSNEDATFSITGYAYSGSGRKISRVEVSLDSGKTWKFCSVGYPTQPTKHGMYWSWCFWETRVDVMELVESTEIVVRAWDSAMNTQPENPSWNFLGTMNNCWYRVKIHREKLVDDPEAFQDEQAVFFEHPTQPGNLTGGWLDTSQALVPEVEKDVTIKLMHQESSTNLDLGSLDQLPSSPLPQSD